MKNFNLLAVAVVMLFAMSTTSCKHIYYQVYNTKAVDEKQMANTNDYTYETKDYTINYAFWGMFGNPGFEIVNKSDDYISIDLRKSFFIRNDYAYNYIQEENALYDKSAEIKPYVIVPPHAKKVVTRFEINKEVYEDCDLNIKPRKSESLSYTQDNSPLTFGNILHIQVGERTPDVLSHSFYVNRITNYNRKHFNMKGNRQLPNVAGTVYTILDSFSVKLFKISCKGQQKSSSKGNATVSVPSSCFYTPYYL